MARKRNPMARDLLTNPLYRAKRSKSRTETALKADRWNRRAKHKASNKSPEPGHGSGDFHGGRRYETTMTPRSSAAAARV